MFPTNFLSGWYFHWCKWGIKVPHCYCITINFSFYGCLHLLCALRGSYVGCTYICRYIFFLDWSLHHYLVSFVVCCNSLYFLCCLLLIVFILKTFFFFLTSLCHLVGAFDPFTYKVIIDICIPIAIFLKILVDLFFFFPFLLFSSLMVW